MAAKYSPQQALELIRKILDEGGYPRPTNHCWDESMPKRDVDLQDIEILLLETGRIIREPEWDDEHQSYKYRIEGPDDLGEELTAIVEIDEIDETSRRVIIITVF